jgi:hypothetical protein
VVILVEVRAADSAERWTHEDLVGTQFARLFDVVNAKVVLAMESDGFHLYP